MRPVCCINVFLTTLPFPKAGRGGGGGGSAQDIRHSAAGSSAKGSVLDSGAGCATDTPVLLRPSPHSMAQYKRLQSRQGNKGGGGGS